MNIDDLREEMGIHPEIDRRSIDDYVSALENKCVELANQEKTPFTVRMGEMVRNVSNSFKGVVINRFQFSNNIILYMVEDSSYPISDSKRHEVVHEDNLICAPFLEDIMET